MRNKVTTSTILAAAAFNLTIGISLLLRGEQMTDFLGLLPPISEPLIVWIIGWLVLGTVLVFAAAALAQSRATLTTSTAIKVLGSAGCGALFVFGYAGIPILAIAIADLCFAFAFAGFLRNP